MKKTGKTMWWSKTWVRQALTTGIFLIAIQGKLFAQIIISPLWPDRGITPSGLLWNISLVSTQTDRFSVLVQMVVADAGTGLPLYTATSNPFVIGAGANLINFQQVQPVLYNNVSSAYRFNPANGGLLPPGIFNVCYKVIKYSGEILNLVLGEGCFSLENDPLSPPTLVTPSDGDSISTIRPFFSWLPPTPNDALPLLRYTIRVVEKDKRQSPQEAVERNLPLFNDNNMIDNNTGYPFGLPPLDTGKSYAWQVLAYNESRYVGASECWSFVLKTDEASITSTKEGAYAPLVSDGAAQVVSVKDGWLRFSYNNEAGDTLLNCIISNRLAEAGKPASSFTHQVSISPGNNYISVDLQTVDGLKKKMAYELHTLNARNERWWVNFVWEQK